MILVQKVISVKIESRLESIDDARRAIVLFLQEVWRNFAMDKIITDQSLLPPCKSSLERHIRGGGGQISLQGYGDNHHAL